MFDTLGLKSIHSSYNAHTCFPIITSNAVSAVYLLMYEVKKGWSIPLDYNQ